jgi:hypothetical protein
MTVLRAMTCQAPESPPMKVKESWIGDGLHGVFGFEEDWHHPAGDCSEAAHLPDESAACLAMDEGSQISCCGCPRGLS